MNGPGRRLFIAIEVPAGLAGRLADLVPPEPGVKRIHPGAIHLTLHFLGDVEDDRCEPLVAALQRLQAEPFRIAIRGSGTFPPRGRPTVLWAGVAASSPLNTVQTSIGATLDRCGLAFDHRPYVPHVTLARLMPAAPRGWVATFLDTTRSLAMNDIPVDRFHLYASTRRDGRTEHAIEATFPLGGDSRNAKG